MPEAGLYRLDVALDHYRSGLDTLQHVYKVAGLILGLRPANDRQCSTLTVAPLPML